MGMKREESLDERALGFGTCFFWEAQIGDFGRFKLLDPFGSVCLTQSVIGANRTKEGEANKAQSWKFCQAQTMCSSDWTSILASQVYLARLMLTHPC